MPALTSVFAKEGEAVLYLKQVTKFAVAPVVHFLNKGRCALKDKRCQYRVRF